MIELEKLTQYDREQYIKNLIPKYILKLGTEVKTDDGLTVSFGDNWGCYTLYFSRDGKRLGYVDFSIWSDTLSLDDTYIRYLLIKAGMPNKPDVWSHG